MTRYIAYAIIALMLPSSAAAGAWPRTEGEGFLSFKAGVAQGSEASYAVFGEYGATRRLTLGLVADRYTMRTGEVQGFTRFALTPDTATQISAEFNAGYAYDSRPATWPVMADRLSFGGAIMVGRGFATPLGAAWADVRIGRRSTLDQLHTENETKLTAGISPTDQFKLFVDIEHDIVTQDRAAAETFTTVAPTIAIELIEGTHATFGYSVDPVGELPSRIDMGVWLAF